MKVENNPLNPKKEIVDGYVGKKYMKKILNLGWKEEKKKNSVLKLAGARVEQETMISCSFCSW